MAYASAVFYLNLEGGSDTARTALTSCTASNPSGTVTRINKTAHGLVTGAVVDLTLFSTWLNDAWKITKVDADNFDLDTAVWQTTADASGTATPRGGSSKTDAWLTFTSGATAARIQPGDTIRVMATTDETLVGSATWTNNSTTITLGSAVTLAIDDATAAWTAATNVTCATNASFKIGAASSSAAIATAFTTGKAAFHATGTLNLSSYQQVTFWIQANATIAASTLSLRLCSDTLGATSVNTIAIPAIPIANKWHAITVDTGGALGSSIQSVALYADLDPGVVTVLLNNITACKASSSADALTLNSLIGKVHNLAWVASTAYSLNDKRRPTQPNRNGFQYKVTTAGTTGSGEPTWPDYIGGTVTDGSVVWTCEELEDTWYAIQSFSGTTLKLEGSPGNTVAVTRGYPGATETLNTYKREPFATALAAAAGTVIHTLTDTGTANSPITYSGGWNRTDMTTQTGETWTTGRSGCGNAYSPSGNNGAYNVELINLHAVRYSYGFVGWNNNGGFYKLTNASANHLDNASTGTSGQSPTRFFLKGFSSMANNAGGGFTGTTNYDVRRAKFDSSPSANQSGFDLGSAASSPGIRVRAEDCYFRCNPGYGLSASLPGPVLLFNCKFSNNSSGSINDPYGCVKSQNGDLADSTEWGTPTAGLESYRFSGKNDQTANSHLITYDGGTIISATDQRNTASGISWKFRITSTKRGQYYPVILPVAQLALSANVTKTLSIYTRRDATDIQGQLRVRGGQLAGVPESTVACAPSINTWVQSGTISVTPTEDGILEVEFLCWDGVGTTNNMWIDDFTVA